MVKEGKGERIEEVAMGGKASWTRKPLHSNCVEAS